MVKSENVVLVQYEFDAYIPLSDTNVIYDVRDVLLAEDKFVTSAIESNETNWTRVKNFQVIYTEDREVNNSLVKIRRRICGLFDAEPFDWKHAKIVIREKKNKRYHHAIAKMPISPIAPVVFDFEGRDL